MTEEETIAEFNVRVLDIANESDVLGEKMSDSKLVRKVLRSLPSKFQNSRVSFTNTLAINATVVKPPQQLSPEYQALLHLDCTEGRTINEVKKTMTLQNLRSMANESSVMSVKDLDILKLNVQPISKHKKKSLVATFSDEEDYSESDDE
ncbi:gag-pol polyprotein [Cucumis melo var. makuwa]|uniref:Gag-pol polyprotein n=1 Tax=Cucumis melo var. makuwa TaxID=1194695 RepID=A0A5D3BRY8_CUCMM|nr:gag-pol polyprotein [Cucumis melo var. makuwa]